MTLSVHQRRRPMRTPTADTLEVRLLLPRVARRDLERATAVVPAPRWL